MWPFDDKTSWKLWPPSVVYRKTKHNASRGAVTAITARSKKGGRKPSLRPTLSKEHYVGGEDVNRDANCAPMSTILAGKRRIQSPTNALAI
jgi:hypothetical protein